MTAPGIRTIVEHNRMPSGLGVAQWDKKLLVLTSCCGGILLKALDRMVCTACGDEDAQAKRHLETSVAQVEDLTVFDPIVISYWLGYVFGMEEDWKRIEVKFVES